MCLHLIWLRSHTLPGKHLSLVSNVLHLNWVRSHTRPGNHRFLVQALRSSRSRILEFQMGNRHRSCQCAPRRVRPQRRQFHQLACSNRSLKQEPQMCLHVTRLRSPTLPGNHRSLAQALFSSSSRKQEFQVRHHHLRHFLGRWYCQLAPLPPCLVARWLCLVGLPLCHKTNHVFHLCLQYSATCLHNQHRHAAKSHRRPCHRLKCSSVTCHPKPLPSIR
mmetsp:Transcript_41853/g.66485  ORF Transcript_41853/g.66485 Transcript_41853/m.66485 type:complete len:219 (-) Transcript_41853:1644-2300(-)